MIYGVGREEDDNEEEDNTAKEKESRREVVEATQKVAEDIAQVFTSIVQFQILT